MISKSVAKGSVTMLDPAGIVSLSVTAAQLAWNLYKKCRDCPGQYKELSDDTKQLASMLREVEDLMTNDGHHVGSKKVDCFGSIESCYSLLVELRDHLDRFQKLSNNQRTLPDRLKWDLSQVQRLHTRINHNIQILSMSLHRYNTCAQVKIIRLLDDVLEQLRDGSRDRASVSSFAALEEGREDEVWPVVVQDLEGFGLEEDTANDNRELIVDILRAVDFDASGSIAEANVGIPKPLDLDSSQTASTGPELDADTMTSGSQLEQSLTDEAPLDSTHSRFDSGAFILINPAHHRHDSTNLPSESTKKYVAIFDTLGVDVEREVKKQADTLKDDINLARRYWEERAWSECVYRLLRLLVASGLPRHRRKDLNFKLIAFLLGVAVHNDGNLETARLIFSTLLADSSDTSATCASPTTPISQGRPDPNLLLPDSGIAAAFWLGDILTRTDRESDAAFAYSIALYALQQRAAAASKDRTSSVTSEPVVQPLSEASLKKASMPRDSSARPLSQQILASELNIANESIGNVNELVDEISAEEFPSSNSVFDGLQIPQTPLSIMADVLPSTDQLSSTSYPLFRGYRARMKEDASIIKSCEYENSTAAASANRASILQQLPDAGTPANDHPIPATERLTAHATRTGWPLLWNPSFSLGASLHVSHWYHNATPAPDGT